MLTTRGTIGNTGLYDESVKFDHVRINSGMLIFRPDAAKLSSSYLFLFFQSENFRAQREAIVSGAAQPQLPIRNLNEARIPLPPLATQQAIVAEIEAEQALVAANRELITRFEKKIRTTLARVWGRPKPMNTPNDESGFQLLMIYAILSLGRWPRLGWYWACGPSDFSANVHPHPAGATPQVSPKTP